MAVVGVVVVVVAKRRLLYRHRVFACILSSLSSNTLSSGRGYGKERHVYAPFGSHMKASAASSCRVEATHIPPGGGGCCRVMSRQPYHVSQILKTNNTHLNVGIKTRTSEKQPLMSPGQAALSSSPGALFQGWRRFLTAVQAADQRNNMKHGQRNIGNAISTYTCVSTTRTPYREHRECACPTILIGRDVHTTYE